MATSIMSPVSLTSYFDNATGEAKQANLFFYKAQTLDPITVYTDSLLRVPHPSPVVTTGFGRVPPVYVGEMAEGYRVRTFDQYQTLIEDIDQLPGAPPEVDDGGGSGITPEPGQLAQVGEMRPFWSNHQNIAGWIECDGRTIGNASSNATAWQSEEARRLFVWLWQNDKVGAQGTPTDSRYAVLTVVGGKGDSADGDFDFGKQIFLPDMRGRLIGGIDGVTTDQNDNTISATGRMDKGLFSNIIDLNTGSPPLGNPILPERINKSYELGAYGGEDVHKLVVTELAVHLHDWWDTTGHTHYVRDPTHFHAISDPKHEHTYQAYSVGTGFSTGPDAGTSSRTLRTATTNMVATGIVATNYAATNILLGHVNYPYPGEAGYGSDKMYIGTYVAATTVDPIIPAHYSSPTKNMPKNEADGALEADRGDKPHNTLAPFLLVCWYIKS